MKKIFFSALAIIAITFTACNNNGGKEEPQQHDMSKMSKDSMPATTVTNDKEVKAVAVTYTDVNAAAAASIKEIIGQYLYIKNALVTDDGREAAKGGKEMEEAISKLDKSFLTAEQKKAYDEIEEDLKEHAEHIGKNGGNIGHQREHFSMMSEDVYDLAKAFGGGKSLYHDHCPMYNHNKGAMWLSETKEVKNPYYGSEMLTCGSVEEVIK